MGSREKQLPLTFPAKVSFKKKVPHLFFPPFFILPAQWDMNWEEILAPMRVLIRSYFCSCAFFLTTLCGSQDLSSWIKDGICASCSGNVES